MADQPADEVHGELSVHDRPRMATPATAPSSRLVLLVEAAMPECSAGTLVRADDVTGTMTIPKPMPATPGSTRRWTGRTAG